MIYLLPEILRMSTAPVCIRRSVKRGLNRVLICRGSTIAADDIDIIVIDCINIVFNLKKEAL